VVLNKADLLEGDQRARAVRRFLKGIGWRAKSFIISALTGEGCRELAFAVMDHLEQQRSSAAAMSGAPGEAGEESPPRTRGRGSNPPGRRAGTGSAGRSAGLSVARKKRAR
jgi:putative protein kinase ArgK-like GTPase of G3E family